MKIKGLQKVTLIDYPNKIACTLFLFGCNFRCGFCHNPELVLDKTSEIYSEEEILDYLRKRTDYLEGVCITGGEPLMSLEEDFLKKIKDLGYSIKIDTNGSFPEKLKELIEKGFVDYVAMDIKAGKDQYSRVANADADMNKIENSIKLITNSGIDYEFRTTVVKNLHDIEEVKKIAEWINNILGRKPKKFVLQGFKNKGKLLDGVFKQEKDVETDYLEELKKAVKDYFEIVEIKG